MYLFVVFLLKLSSISAFNQLDSLNSKSAKAMNQDKPELLFAGRMSGLNPSDQFDYKNADLPFKSATTTKRRAGRKFNVFGITRNQRKHSEISKITEAMNVIINAVQTPKMVTLSQKALKGLESGHVDMKDVTNLMDAIRITDSPARHRTTSLPSNVVNRGVNISKSNEILDSEGDNLNSTNIFLHADSRNATKNGGNVTGGRANVSADANIEVVILQPSMRATRRPKGRADAGRRFPSAILNPSPSNITVVHNSHVVHTYPTRSYWPIYLTLTMMCVCVLGVFVICCSADSRRRMSGPQHEPATKYQDQELPPYPYSFSYDMRTVDTHPISQVR